MLETSKITRSHVLKTLLGSCIEIVLYDPIKKIGGLLHIMLPRRNSDDLKLTSRHGLALLYLTNDYRRRGNKGE